MIRQNKHRPFYRDVVPTAWKETWKHRHLWWLALPAILLQTGGVLDALIASFRGANLWGRWFLIPTIPWIAARLWVVPAGSPAWILSLEQWIMGLIVIAAFLVLALICQAGLAFGLGSLVHGRIASLRECLAHGGSKLRDVALLNLITLGIPWLGRILLGFLMARAVTSQSTASATLYLVVGIAFVIVTIALIALHFFALYALVLQEATLRDALARGWRLVSRGWIAVAELGMLLFGVGIVMGLIAILITAIALIPVFILFYAFLLLDIGFLALLAALFGAVLCIVVLLVVAAVTVQFQYALWHRLFLRLGEGGIVAKLHRLYRSAVNA